MDMDLPQNPDPAASRRTEPEIDQSACGFDQKHGAQIRLDRFPSDRFHACSHRIDSTHDFLTGRLNVASCRFALKSRGGFSNPSLGPGCSVLSRSKEREFFMTGFNEIKVSLLCR